ncbi:DEAD/DEAH box helicase [Priestia megaterium]|uniref:DEAD/DEAH box helicase n=1 Tax=Priestia megaterium TaxID=1404 RepID=UPI00345A505E
MSKSTLPQKLFNLSGYQEKYKPLLYQSIINQFELIHNSTSTELDINYLLMCGSIFAESDDVRHLDSAYRIAQHVIQDEKTSDNQKNSAAFILDKMTNHSAINLAVNRNQLVSNYQENVPFHFQLNSMNRLMKYSIFDSGRDSIMPINKFQYEVLDEVRKNDWISISAPTSAGKSFILLQLIRMFLEENPNGLIIYLVPTRSLIQQVEKDIRKMLIEHKESDVFISTVPSFDTVDQRFNKLVFVLTQERFQWLLSESNQIKPDMLIVDEAQKIGDGTRGILLQQVIEDVARRSPNSKVIFSSPLTSNPEALLEQNHDSIRKETIEREIVTVNQNLLWVNQIYRKPREWEVSFCVDENVVSLGKVNLNNKPTSEMERLAYLTHALADPIGGNLVYANIPSNAEKCADILWRLQGSDNNSTHPDILELIKLIKETVNPNYNLAHFLTRKIGYHYGNMPLIIKNEIERLFSEGIIQFLVCTSTLIEGMNLPARSIFVRGPQKGRGKPMGEMDFWNLAGRAGRQGKEYQGNVICIDTNKQELWNNSPPMTRKKYKIEKTMENLLMHNIEKLTDFIDKKTPRELSLKQPELEYGFSYLVGEKIRNEGLKGSPFLQKYNIESIEKLEISVVKALSQVEIPEEILLKHPGVSPLVQQNLFNFFKDNYLIIDLYSPVHPNNDDALERYKNIVDKIQEILSGEHPGKNYPFTLLILEWMRGYPLARIIDRNWRYWQKNDPKKKLQGVIRDTMKDIEEFARFKFVKYFSCYRDLLNYFMEANNIPIKEELSNVNIWLELGTSQTTQISLMGLGFTRTTAIAISEVLKDPNLNSEDCIDLLKQIKWEGVSFSPIIHREINQILKLYVIETK